MAGSLYIVATPIGHSDDLSLRAIRVLKSVSVIACESPEQTSLLCTAHGIETPLTSYQNDNKEEKAPVLLKTMQEGRDVALAVDAGTPLVVDPGSLLVQQAAAHGIRIIPLPGPSALLAALSIAGLPGESFLFHGRLPVHTAACRRLFRAWRQEPRTLVLFIEPDRLIPTLRLLCTALGTRHAVLAADLTTPDEQVVRGTLEDILRHAHARPIRRELTLVIAGTSRQRKNKAVRNKRRVVRTRRVSE